VEISDGAMIKCSHKSCVKVVNKSNLQSKTPFIVTHTHDNINVRNQVTCITTVPKLYARNLKFYNENDVRYSLFGENPEKTLKSVGSKFSSCVD
jgi:hypothetical protein